MREKAHGDRRSVLSLSVLVFSTLLMASCSAQEQKGLVACWRFDEGKGDMLLDTSGHGNHGRIHGATWIEGRVGGGLRFDGVDDYVEVPKSASLNSITKEITLMCWIKTPLAGRHTILERWPCGRSNQRCLVLDVDSEEKLARFAISPTGGTGTWHKFTNTIPVNKWVHIAATFDGKTMRIYVNGRPDPSPSVLENPRIHPSTADLHIGAWNSSSDKWECFFKGSMDEIKIYSRALTAEEVLQQYWKESPRGTVAGRITDVGGNPIGGTTVEAGPFRAVTDRDGRYTITVPAKTYDVKVAGRGYKRGTRPDVKVKEGGTAKADIVLIEDRTPPVITELKVERVDGVNATVLWKTNEKCCSKVKYGTSPRKYKNTAKDASYSKSHRIVLTGLANDTKYYFVAESTDGAENITRNKEQTFSTQKVIHPFLIVKKSDYAKLRARAAKAPWKKMKADAISYVNSHSYDPKDMTQYGKRRSMSAIVSAGALAYILDPANRTSYKNKVRDTLMYWDDLYASRDYTVNYGGTYNEWRFAVPAGTAFFNSVLALDIIYNDLTLAERADITARLDTMANYYRGRGTVGWWPLNMYGCRGIWALYQGDRSRIDSAKNGYRSTLKSQITPDGVFAGGTGYCWARYGGGRDAKSSFMDVLEFTGEGTYYSDERMRKLYEWLYRGCLTPFRRTLTFGDSTCTSSSPTGQGGCAPGYRAHRFSKQAARNAAWVAHGTAPRARLLSYVLMDQPLPASERPSSHIWGPSGCATFREDSPSDRSLMGVLWNCKQVTAHAHKEVNALHLCAYGEHVLRNAGYGVFSHTTWICETAVSGNTVLIDDSNHISKKGGGIIEGFTAPRFDYARGYSGPALPSGKHWRDFVFVHPQDGRNGYWVLFDEVDADSSLSSVNIALHPNSDECTTVSDRLEYRWKISAPVLFSGHDVFFTVFLGTAPTSVSIKVGYLAYNLDGKYLYSTYSTDGKGRRNIVTVLFPHDAKHAKAKMTRITGKDYSGAEVNLGNSVTDVAIESSGKKAVKYDKVLFRGLAVLYRLKDKANAFYFVRKGRIFDDGAKPRLGFESDKDITVYIKGDHGRIISPGAEVTFYYPGIKDVFLDSKAAPAIGSGNGWIKVAVGKGTHDLEFGLQK